MRQGESVTEGTGVSKSGAQGTVTVVPLNEAPSSPPPRLMHWMVLG